MCRLSGAVLLRRNTDLVECVPFQPRDGVRQLVLGGEQAIDELEKVLLGSRVGAGSDMGWSRFEDASGTVGFGADDRAVTAARRSTTWP